MRTITIFFNGFKLTLMIMCMMMSCTNNKNDERMLLQSRIDSLEQVNQQTNEELADMRTYVKVLADGLDSIAFQEDLLLNGSKGREGVSLDREQLKKNLDTFEDKLSQQKQRIAQLVDSLRARGENMERLMAIIEHLNKQLEEKDATIKQLRADLDKKNVNIAQLNTRIKNLSDNNDKLTSKVERQKEALTTQTDMINEGYVKIGTKQELKASGIVTGGLFKKKQINTDRIDKNLFMRVDIRNFTEITIESGTIKILTQMPTSSYRIIKNNSNSSTLYIDDPTLFWSISNYLVIQKTK